MPNFADSLKAEIARVARKELKSEIQFLRKSLAGHRSEIAALKRDIKSLQANNKALRKQVAVPARASASVAAAAEPGKPRRGRAPAPYSAEAFAATRQRLQLTQAQMGTLLGVSALSVYKWESGQVVPRAKQQAKVIALRKMGPREARRTVSAAAA